ncbi:hypothetical protein DDI_2777 [Dickeya dianthicola RNS04.9]|nr:hypothetical protein DDI_2777 [Dickeya dianthicola RNS04.9]
MKSSPIISNIVTIQAASPHHKNSSYKKHDRMNGNVYLY